MSYEPNTWECGDTITADKLNNIEEGVAEALDCCGGSKVIVFTATEEEIECPDMPEYFGTKYTYSHSWQEIYDALGNGTIIVMPMHIEVSGVVANGLDLLISAYINDGKYFVAPAYEAQEFVFPDATGKVYIDDCGK